MAKPRKHKLKADPAPITGRRRLKVFRTPIGFHDAYVAAPSRQAALDAWGADSNLFAQGLAEAVDDPELMTEPLAAPGVVIKRARGSAEQHLAAAGRAPKGRKKPSRAKLDEAEKALAEIEERQAAEMRTIEREQKLLRERRKAIERRQEAELRAAVDKRDRAKADYDRRRGG